MILTHEVGVGLLEGSQCRVCDGHYVKDNEPDGAPFLFCYTCEDKVPRPFKRWRMRYPKIPHAPNQDVFASLEKLSTDKELSAMYACDVDTGSLADAERVHSVLKALAGDVFDIYNSGNKGYHIVLPYEVFAYKNPNWAWVFRALAENHDILSVVDSSIYKPNALLRVPDTVNTKSGRAKTLIQRRGGDELSAEWFEAVAEAEASAGEVRFRTQEGDKTPFALLQHYMPPCVQRLLLDGLPGPGTRHEATLHLISYYYRKGEDEDAAQSELEFFATDNTTSTPLITRLAEAERLTSHAYSHGTNFNCERAQDLGICEETCKLAK